MLPIQAPELFYEPETGEIHDDVWCLSIPRTRTLLEWLLFHEPDVVEEKERKKMMIMNRKKDCFSNESSVLDSQTLSVSESDSPLCIVSIAPVVPHSRWVLQPFAPHTHIASLVWYGYDEPTQKYPVSYVKGYTALL